LPALNQSADDVVGQDFADVIGEVVAIGIGLALQAVPQCWI
jgi:hypothetical protein